jgi:hypothetical protein
MSNRSRGTYTRIEGFHSVLYDEARVLRDCEYTLDAQGTATLLNVASAPQMTNPKATIDITFDGQATKRFSAVWSESVQNEEHWEKILMDSTSYQGTTQAFYVNEPGKPGKRRAGVACGVTKIGDGGQLYKAERLVITACLDPYPVAGADGLPVTHYTAGLASDRLEQEDDG